MWAQEEITGNSPPGTSKDFSMPVLLARGTPQRRRGDLLIESHRNGDLENGAGVPVAGADGSLCAGG